MTKALVFLAEGFEEIEALSVVDILRRAGIEVHTAGIGGSFITGSHKIKVASDVRFIDINPKEYDVLIIPGGPAVDSLLRDNTILKTVDEFAKSGKLVAAICAGPRVLAKLGLLKEKRATVYPGYEKELGYPRPDRVVVDGNIITSQGPGTSLDFALKIVEVVSGPGKSAHLRKEMVF